jgi:hypothetical protein
VVARQSEEFADHVHYAQRQSCLYRSHLLGVHGDTLLRDDVTQVGDRRLLERALAALDRQLMLP